MSKKQSKKYSNRQSISKVGKLFVKRVGKSSFALEPKKASTDKKKTRTVIHTMPLSAFAD